MRERVRIAIVGAWLVVAMAATAVAHHSFSPFDMATSKTIDGTVKQIDWTNPHIWIWLDVPNAQGGVDTWGFEGMSPNFLARRGWTRTTLKAGDKITVTYRPLKDGSKGGMFVSTKAPDGRALTMGGGEEK